jgi:hypothetical protein
MLNLNDARPGLRPTLVPLVLVPLVLVPLVLVPLVLVPLVLVPPALVQLEALVKTAAKPDLRCGRWQIFEF